MLGKLTKKCSLHQGKVYLNSTSVLRNHSVNERKTPSISQVTTSLLSAVDYEMKTSYMYGWSRHVYALRGNFWLVQATMWKT